MRIPTIFTLIIAEKPRAAEKIAQALAGTSCKKLRVEGVPIWVINTATVKSIPLPLVVASAAGHLFSLHSDEFGYPVFSCRWVPRYLVEKEARHTRRFLEVLEDLCKKARVFVNACDYDIEGSLIGYLVIKFFGDERRAYRAKFSSLVPSEIRSSFSRLSKLDKEMAEAGECRHILDWLWGINVSRALMDIYRRFSGRTQTLSAGRVQTPTLAHAVEIDLKRKFHVPIPLLYPRIVVELDGKSYQLEYEGPPFTSREEAQRFIACAKRAGELLVVDIDERVERIPPPPPFNLPDLQSEAARIHRISPYVTQRIAEDLYLDALISYPRTNSQRLPPTLNNRAIVENLAKYPPLGSLARRLLDECRGVLRPHNGPKTDPAHPAIYPTGEIPRKKLSEKHRKIYELIVRRYLSTFSSDAVVRRITIHLEVCGKRFSLRGVRIDRVGWMLYYPYSKPREREIPQLRRHSRIPISKASIKVSYSSPPPPLTRMGLIKWMESQGIGTESTRAEIVETLYRRGYIVKRGRSSEVSDLGIAVVKLLSKYVPELCSTELTRHFERAINAIIDKRMHCAEVIDEAKKVLTHYLNRIKKLSSSIASELALYIEDPRNEPRCALCRRKAVSQSLCVFHMEAYRLIKQNYEHWLRAGYRWDQYLRKLSRSKLAGAYIRDVATFLLREGVSLEALP